MKILTIVSPKYGEKKILLDDEDYEWCIKYVWHVWKNKNNFYVRKANDKDYNKKDYMHRMILNINDSEILVDHKDHNGLNNQKNNLRQCSNHENKMNSCKKENLTSKYLGVSWSEERKKWVSQININKKRKSLGRFNNEEDAAKAYDVAAKQSYGQFANLNFK